MIRIWSSLCFPFRHSASTIYQIVQIWRVSEQFRNGYSLLYRCICIWCVFFVLSVLWCVRLWNAQGMYAVILIGNIQQHDKYNGHSRSHLHLHLLSLSTMTVSVYIIYICQLLRVTSLVWSSHFGWNHRHPNELHFDS